MHLSGEWAGRFLGGEFGLEGLLGMVISYGMPRWATGKTESWSYINSFIVLTSGFR